MNAMPTDGNTDYGSYTRAQLEEALSNIDAEEYPVNHAQLVKELARRPTWVAEAAVLPERLVLAGMWYLVAIRILVIGFVGFALLLLLHAAGVLPSDSLGPATGQGESLFGAGILLIFATMVYFDSRSLRSVVVIGHELVVRSFRRTERIPLMDILEFEWLEEPRGNIVSDGDPTPLASLWLERPYSFGYEIRFAPDPVRNARTFERYLAARAANEEM